MLFPNEIEFVGVDQVRMCVTYPDQIGAEESGSLFDDTSVLLGRELDTPTLGMESFGLVGNFGPRVEPTVAAHITEPEVVLEVP
jgi:hypothetical protein